MKLVPVDQNIATLLQINFNNIENLVSWANAYILDKTAYGSKRIIQASSDCRSFQRVSAKIALDFKGIFEWDVIVKKDCDSNFDEYVYVGVCTSENLDFNGITRCSDSNVMNG